MLKACLNGAREPDAHPALPVSAEALAVDAAACVAAGVQALHVHPRGADGRESLRASVIDATVGVLHEAVPGVAIGVSTGAWIVPDPRERAGEVASWTASVVPGSGTDQLAGLTGQGSFRAPHGSKASFDLTYQVT